MFLQCFMLLQVCVHGVCVCVHSVCVFTTVCVTFGWVKCRAHNSEYVSPYLATRHFTFTFVCISMFVSVFVSFTLPIFWVSSFTAVCFFLHHGWYVDGTCKENNQKHQRVTFKYSKSLLIAYTFFLGVFAKHCNSIVFARIAIVVIMP